MQSDIALQVLKNGGVQNAHRRFNVFGERESLLAATRQYLSGRNAVALPEGTVKDGIIAVSAQSADVGRVLPVVEKLTGAEEAALADVAVGGDAHVSAEDPGKVEFADEEMVGNEVQRQIPGKVFVDEGNDLLHQLLGC